ncbi:hypothetical protein [Streptomyces formicae]|uniref:Uncharacterized protein n=1 Tax=Streptomyces formicae TaxID=1616117 RepID=A0A291QEJ6_9ACTN|nr:hypothetical protein [Streptomyces formicae]ATL29988.1 hypothetical protein KY5_4970 [Streptomyces formicae]
MPEELGFDELLADGGLIARLLGRTAAGRRRDLLYGDDLPVVLLVGGPGMGKGRLLRCVRGRFGPRVPTAYVDCALTGCREQAEERPRSRSEVTEVLGKIASQYVDWRGDGGGIPVPRLYAGLAAVAASDPLAPATRLVDEVGRLDGLLPPGSFWRGVLKGTAKNYVGFLLGLVTHPLVGPFINALLDGLLARTSKEGRAALTACYGDYPGAGGQPLVGLRSLADDFQQGGEARRIAEGFLLRALRQDIDAAYGNVRGQLTRVGRPALLLDHADGALGRRLLKPVLEDRERGHHDRLVIIATARREDGGRFLHRAGSDHDDMATWRPFMGALPAWSRPPDAVPDHAPLWRGVLRVRMPVLTRDQQKDELSRLRGGREQPDNAVRLRIHSGVHRLSGGRPLFVTRLGEATAAASFPTPEECTDWAILDARVPAGEDEQGRPVADRPVADVLVDELVGRELPEELPPEHRGHWLDLLTHLSVAHDVECAQTLVRAVQEDRSERLNAYRIAELLEDTGWPRCPRHFIGDLGLRRLLTRRLYRLRDGGAAWHADHALLQGHYRDLGDHHADALFVTAGAHRMHHLLASDGADLVTRYLAGTFLTRPAAEWCEELLAVADAALIGADDDRYARALGETQVRGDTLRRRVDRLLHAVWLTEDRIQPLEETVPTVLRGPLRELSEELSKIADEAVRDQGPEGADVARAADGAALLIRMARDWGDRAEDKQPLQRCVCTEHIGFG